MGVRAGGRCAARRLGRRRHPHRAPGRRSLPRAHDPGHRRRQWRREHVDRAREPRQAVDRARPASRGRTGDPAPAPRDGRRVPHQLPTRRVAAPRARRRDAHRAVPVARVHARARLRGAGARCGPRRVRRVGVLVPGWAGARAHAPGDGPADRTARRHGRPERCDGAGVRHGGRVAQAHPHRQGLGGRRLPPRRRDVDAVVGRARRVAGAEAARDGRRGCLREPARRFVPDAGRSSHPARVPRSGPLLARLLPPRRPRRS